MEHKNWEEEIRKEWREEIKRYPEMDALGSADWWIEKLSQVAAEERQGGRDEAVDYISHHRTGTSYPMSSYNDEDTGELSGITRLVLNAARTPKKGLHDKNGHATFSDGTLTWDPACHGCDAPKKGEDVG